jgi:hypothetical protein
MDSFLRRLKYYGLGFGMGLVFVLFFFQNRGCSWLPSNRVKNSFLDRLIVVPESQNDVLNAKKITEKDIIAVLNDGKVDFGKSKKKGSTKVYDMYRDFGNRGTIHFYFTLPQESFISEVRLANQPINTIKDETKGYGKIIHFPNDKNLVFVDTSSLLKCQQKAIGFVNAVDIFKRIKQTGRIDFTKTNFTARPKAIQFIEFNDKNGRKIGARAIWYKSKINITAFQLPFVAPCQDFQ